MNNHVSPEFFRAFDHYKAMLAQYGEQRLLQMMDNRQQVGLSNDGVLINSNIHINRVQ